MLLIEIVKLMYEAGWRASHAYHNFGVSQDFFIIQKFVGHGQELTHIFTQPSNFDLSDLYCFDHSDRGSIFAAVTRTTIQPFAWCLAIFPNLYFKVSCQNRILWTSNFGLGKNIKMNLMETIMKTSKSPITTTNSYWVQKASAIVLKALCHWVAQTGLIWHWHLLSVTCMLVVTSRRPGRVSAEWVLFPRRRGEGQQIAPRVGQPGSENCPATWVPTKPFSRPLMEVKMHDPWLSRWPPDNGADGVVWELPRLLKISPLPSIP